MTDAELTDIEKRTAAATPGPWLVRGCDKHPPESGYKALPCVYLRDSLNNGVTADDDNAAFIAHARQDVPALVAALRAERAEVARLREALKRIDGNGADQTWAGNVARAALRGGQR